MHCLDSKADSGDFQRDFLGDEKGSLDNQTEYLKNWTVILDSPDSRTDCIVSQKNSLDC